ncbi:MAG: fumarate hydratase, partial [Proteobacteria bacterium]|nr:fumarate hydratase [Pseudomonadota bacterium]
MTISDYHPLLPLGADETQYRKLTSDYVETVDAGGRTILKIDPEGIAMLTAEAFSDTSHLLRTDHLKQLASILDDSEASDNDRFVAYDLLKNANIAAGRILPMCQDTGTAIVMGKKGENVWVDGDDEAAISEGVLRTYTHDNLRYSQLAPLTMYDETNTGDNLPAQIELYADKGDAYKFMFVAKGGGSANKSFLY